MNKSRHVGTTEAVHGKKEEVETSGRRDQVMLDMLQCDDNPPAAEAGSCEGDSSSSSPLAGESAEPRPRRRDQPHAGRWRQAGYQLTQLFAKGAKRRIERWLQDDDDHPRVAEVGKSSAEHATC